MACASQYDVIVVGAGHAGCEAALAASRMGSRTLLLTLNLDGIAMMPCNPAVGGPGKAHLVREIDALGGQMAITTDQTYLQMRTLNSSKGPAVRALRAQVDRGLYAREMRAELESEENLHLRQALVEGIAPRSGGILDVLTATGPVYRAQAVILTAGVFLRGRVITGEHSFESGPGGQMPARKMAVSLESLGLRLGRFKTGTPPRVARDSVDTARLKAQPGDCEPQAFSFLTVPRRRRQLSCWLTHTTPLTHQLIRENLHRAPLFDGTIEGRGPRYCPSIEDKVVRFPDRDSHQVFVEPEGFRTREMYLLGLSTSLPEPVQARMLETIPGLENARILRPGYAIEYDYVDPVQLEPSLMVRGIPGLFTAGQLNGTSGYEEAAAQGLVAGINAVRHVRNEPPMILDRSQAYIGVLIDDLVTKGIDEPYRMLTSRAEFRLVLRPDNADLRLTPIGHKIGLARDLRLKKMLDKERMAEKEIRRLKTTAISPGPESSTVLSALGSSPLTETQRMADLLRRPELSYGALAPLDRDRPEIDLSISQQVEIQIKYAGYIAKQAQQVNRFQNLEHKQLPGSWDYGALGGLSNEAREKLQRIRPRSVGQALRIPGVSTADVAVLLVQLEAQRRRGEQD